MLFPLTLFLALGSGTAALAHELLWTRRCIDLLGASAASSARVFGCFFLGLALGAAVATRLTPRLRRPWRALAWIELSVALLALPALFLPMWTDWLWPAIGPEQLLSGLGTQLKLALSFGMVFPPAFAMGLFLPVMATAVLGTSRPLSRHGIWLYSANTLGGVVGLLIVIGLTLPHLGAIGSMLTAMGVNLIVALTCWVIDRFQQPLPQSQISTSAAPSKSGPQPVDGVTLALAAASGAGILAAEIVALDAIQLVATMSFYAPAVVLATVLGVLALSALIVPRLSDRSVDNTIIGCLIGAGLALAFSPLLFMQIAQHWNPFAAPLSVLAFGLALAGLTMVLLGPGLFMAAFVFPLLMRRCSQAGDERGQGLGWLLALNGLGGFLGAELAYRLILPNFGPHQGMGVVGLFYGVVALATGLILHREAQRLNRLWRLLPGVGACLIVGLLMVVLKTLPVVNPKAGFQLVDLKFGREGNLAVVDHPRMGRAMLAYNQYMLGSTDARYDQERQAHIPLLVHPKPSQIAFIGLATGMTPGAALLHPEVEMVHAVELSSQVVDAADQYFQPHNHGVTRDPRAQMIIEDGRTWIAASQARYDAIIGDLFLPWRAGVGRLYSLEHFRAVRRALRDGGVFCQWLPMFQLGCRPQTETPSVRD